MAKYFIDQTDQTTTEELPTVYTNTPTVSYVINSDDPQVQHGQSIILGNDQYMVLDNVIDQSTITFQNQFELPPGQQQIYYMETDDNVQSIDTIQAQPVLMNNAMQAGTPQKVIMVQQSQPSMIIQQPQMIQRPIHKPIQPRIQTQINIASPPRIVFTNPPRPVINSPSPRPTVPTRIAVPRTATQRTVSPIQRTVTAQRPQLVPALVQNRAQMKQPIRAGVIQSNTPPLALPGASRTVTRATLPVNDGRKLLNAAVVAPGEIIPNISPAEESSGVEGESTVISMQEYQQLLADRKRAAENKMLNRNKTAVKKPPAKVPVMRPANVTQTATKPQLLVNEEESARLEKEGKRHKNARIIKPKDNNKLPAILKNFVPPPEIRDIITKTQHTLEFQNSIRMFVIHESGEQRLITFTMPKEDCTIQEILEQVGVPIAANTKIAISETNTDGINLVVSVGIPVEDDTEEEAQQTHSITQPTLEQQVPPKVATPELSAPQENETSRFIPGMLAVCTHCGFLSDDFNKCIRCKSKLPDGIKAVPSSNFYKKGTDGRTQKPTIAIHLKNNGTNIKPSTSLGSAKKKINKPKVVDQEPVILTLSSDDEDDRESQASSTDHLSKKPESQLSVLKEPTLSDFNENGTNDAPVEDSQEAGGEARISATLFCRTIRIGSYSFQSSEEVNLSTHELTLRVPIPDDKKTLKTVKIPRNAVVKVLVNFQKILPVVFIYVTPSVGEAIRSQLGMTSTGECYFDPVADEEPYKRITLLLDGLSEETKWVFKEIYGAINKIEELNAKEANIILVKSCPKEVTKPPPTTQTSSLNCFDVKQLLIYPQGKGGLSINTEDYLCLAQDQFLNDVIIDFYLKYLVLNLPTESQEKIHVFSTFFYKRLTTKPAKPSRRSHPAELDPTLNAAQKRHSRVKNWTKNVNLFEKDYVIVPINENAHWFLAIICFPGMNGAHTLDGNPITLEPNDQKKKRIESKLTLRQMKIEKAATVNCDDGDLSDKDEAEGDESELDSNEDSDEATTPTSTPVYQPEPAIKQPCILIFDSLAGASRARVVATLRDYLTCEYKIKQGNVKVYNKDVIKGACPKIPQQTNYTDCGLYLLQYVESFFQDPIVDYRLPISTLKQWFSELTVTKKREDISNLIKTLMVKYNKNVSILPQLQFPTLNGELVENQHEEEEEAEAEAEEEEEEETASTPRDESENENVTSSQDSPIKPSESSTTMETGFREESTFNTSKVKPDMKEVPNLSNRDTMSYLKSKRIIKHRTSEPGEIKKMKMSE